MDAPNTEAVGRAGPLLSICVPTYKRGRHVEALVDVLVTHLLSVPAYSVELVVVENVSPDDTRERLSRLKHPRLRVVNRDRHLDTAEENVFRSLPYLRGRYVWFLGDDDIPQVAAFPAVYAALETDSYDCLIYNSPLISATGRLVRQQPMPMLGDRLEAGIGEIVESIGLLFTFAGFSNVIQRRSAVSETRALEWLSTSKIYSHVAWMVEAHKSGRVVFFNSPLVYYRQNDYSDGHWNRVAERNNVQDLFYWTTGLMRLLNELITVGALTYLQVGLILELADDGRRYRLLDDMVFKVHQQLVLWVDTEDSRQAFSADDIARLRSFFLRCDPTLFDLILTIDDGYADLNAADAGERQEILHKFRDRFVHLFDERQAVGQLASRFVARVNSYDIYRLPTRFVALPADDIEVRERVLRLVDPQTADLDIVVSPDLAELHDLTREARSESMRRAALRATSSQTAVTGAMDPSGELMRLVHDSNARAAQAAEQLASVYRSTSWSLTAPVRAIGRVFRR